jgi:iron complex transport system substrate-binding protein
MKIASLLPSATEIVFTLGLGDSLIGVSGDCDYPPEALSKPVVSRTTLPQGRSMTSAEIDAAVRERLEAGKALYELDTELLRREQPDVIITQDLCRVCGVATGQVEEALDRLGVAEDTKVISLDPNTLEEVIAQIEIVGRLLGVDEVGRERAAELRSRITAAEATAQRLPTVSMLCLDWGEPPSVAGHWVPEMVEAIGGTNLLNETAGHPHPVSHREIRDAHPEVLLYMPCGYGLDDAEEEAERFVKHPEVADMQVARRGNVFAVDATSFFSRSGPRIVDGIEIMAWAVHPEAYPEPSAGTIARVG